MRRTLVLLVIVAITTQAAANAQTRKERFAKERCKISFVTPLADSLKTTVVETVMLFEDVYGSVRSLIVGDDTITSVVHHQDGSTEQTIAYSTSGTIYINKRLRITCRDLRQTIKHELYHSVCPKQALYLKPDKRFATSDDGFVITGYHGLSLIVYNPTTKHTTKFLLIEEAAAEACASKIEHGYNVTSPTYFALGRFMRDIIDIGWISADQLVTEQRTNGIMRFCARLLKKDVTLLTPDDIGFVQTCFQKIADSPDNYTTVMTELIARRGETGKYHIKN